MKQKGAVITFPGSNNDDDCVYTLSKVLECEVDRIWHKDSPDLSVYRLVWLPGGFSYGDYLRCGAIAALSPVMQSVRKFVDNGGLVVGTCNGFQILCESHLLPGALVRNEKLRFICRDVPLRVATNDSFLTCGMDEGDHVSLPIAHGEGRYVADEQTLQLLADQDRIVLEYCDPNPNGSLRNIAGILNQKRNVIGMMPHPERATDLRSQDGTRMWRSLRKWLAGESA